MRESDTLKPLDWAYNAFGIFVGQSRSQFDDASRFDKIVTQKITEELKQKGATIELEKIGLGHSQGGNHVE
jgi:predicted HAD superfamily phosphohydrolase